MSGITNLDDLKKAITLQKQLIELREQDLEQRLERLPYEAVKAAATNLVSFTLNQTLVGSSWHLLKQSIAMLFHKEKSADDATSATTNSFFSNWTKKISLLSIVKLAASLLKQ